MAEYLDVATEAALVSSYDFVCVFFHGFHFTYIFVSVKRKCKFFCLFCCEKVTKRIFLLMKSKLMEELRWYILRQAIFGEESGSYAE